MGENILIKKFKESRTNGLSYILRGIDILKILVNRGFDSYIVDEAVLNLYLCRPIEHVQIATSANPTELKNIFPSLTVTINDEYILKDSEGDFNFLFFDDPKLPNLLQENIALHFNKKLIQVLQSKVFTMMALALAPSLELIDLFNSVTDIDERQIRGIDKPKSIFEEDPTNIYNALLLEAHYGFNIEKKTIKGMSKMSFGLESVNIKIALNYLKSILSEKYAHRTLITIKENHLFRSVVDLDRFVNKLLNNYDGLDEIERLSLLYLIVASIPDAASMDNLLVKEITETITITQLIIHSPVTPMMVYNIGEKKLLSCDKLALTYKSDYKTQKKLIKKLNRDASIMSIRELNFSNLELIKLLNGERSIRIKIIMNLLLEKVINKEIKNYPKALKEEALKLDQEMKAIFNYESTGEEKEYTEIDIDNLLKKYHQELDFLVKVYLNDEKELYSLTPAERNILRSEAEEHAHDFLLETDQYLILEERRLI